MTNKRRTVGILVFNDVEPMDFCGPFEVFCAVRLDPAKRRETISPFDVFLVGLTDEPVVTSGGMTVLPRVAIDALERCDLFVVPGGWGTRALIADDVAVAAIRRLGEASDRVASVCTGALLLGKAGFLRGKRVTTHAGALSLMHELFPETETVAGERYIAQGNVWTSAGISAGIDLALALVADAFGEDVAVTTAAHMEYPYRS